MKATTTLLILACIAGFCCCSKKRNNLFDPVIEAARSLLSSGFGDERAPEMLRNLEREIDRAKHIAPADTKALSSYDSAVRVFHQSLQGQPKSEELWRTAVSKLQTAQHERMGLRNIGSGYWDPPLRNPYPMRSPYPKGISR
jgi:hypothetical protein